MKVGNCAELAAVAIMARIIRNNSLSARIVKTSNFYYP